MAQEELPIKETSPTTWRCGPYTVFFNEVKEHTLIMGVPHTKQHSSLGWRFMVYARSYRASYHNRFGSPWKTLQGAKSAARAILKTLM